MVLIKRGLDKKSQVHVLHDSDVSIDEEKAKKALSNAKEDAGKKAQGNITNNSKKADK